ncbi:hypothetical protein [Novosphingobium sp.]|uniref:hypothetical protein n=1 Tax=Novosphingobium sp. TaxID=1874826 RepID=UPI00286D1633|nr:hypothetical protein [Novosphingobium sp.]
MPGYARFVALRESDAATTLPTNAGQNETTFEGFQAPGINPRAPAVLMFRLNPRGTESVTLRVRLASSNVVLMETTFTTDAARSWHEIIPAGALAADGNQMIVSVTGPGSIQVSDFVFLYDAS